MQLTEHHTAVLSRLLQGEAWKVIMHVYGERLVSLEMQIRQLGMDRDHRLALMERRNELLDMIGRFYKDAEQENPFDSAAGALWATTMKLPEPGPAIHDQPLEEIAEQFGGLEREKAMLASVGVFPPRKGGGSVA